MSTDTLTPRELPPDLSLVVGPHIESGPNMCIMEAVAYVAGEKHSDRPQCACPIISRFLRVWNDDLPSNEDRNRLLQPLIPHLVGTYSDYSKCIVRANLAYDWLVRTYVPIWLDTFESLQVHAAELRSSPEIVNEVTRNAAHDLIVSAESSANKLVGYIVGANNALAGKHAAGYAARHASDRCYLPVYATSVLSAAHAAMWRVSYEDLVEPVAVLQASAVDLVHRMIAA